MIRPDTRRRPRNRLDGGTNVRTLLHLGFALVAIFALAACGGGEEVDRDSELGTDFSPVLAEVDGVPITRGFFDYCYENLSPMDKSRFSGEGWEQRFLDYLIEQRIMVNAAEQENLDMVRETEWRLYLARQSVLYKAYYDKHFGDAVVVPEEEIVLAYEADPEAYRSRGRMTAQHIQCSSKDKIDQAWAELQAGEHWGKVCGKYTEDANTIEAAGSLGWFNPDGYVIGMGFNKEFTDVAFTIEEHTLAPPTEIGGQWHIIRTGAKIPGEVAPLDEVRERIERALRPGLAREVYQKDLRRLKGEQGVEYFGEFAEEERRSAEALYRLAAVTKDAHAKLEYYGRVVELYPEHEKADEALFMQGFVFSEEFGDAPSAARCFKRLKQEYPDSKYNEDAEFMLQNLARSVPELRGQELPSTAEEANERIQDVDN
jgi:tetratricopeptide (TPR) repeat protein